MPAQLFPCTFICFAPPSLGLFSVLRFDLALGVHFVEEQFSKHVSLFGGLAIPLCRLGMVLGDALAAGVHIADSTVGVCGPLLG